MNKVTWIGFGFNILEKEFETAQELIEFICQDDIKPYVRTAIIESVEFKRL